MKEFYNIPLDVKELPPVGSVVKINGQSYAVCLNEDENRGEQSDEMIQRLNRINSILQQLNNGDALLQNRNQVQQPIGQQQPVVAGQQNPRVRVIELNFGINLAFMGELIYNFLKFWFVGFLFTSGSTSGWRNVGIWVASVIGFLYTVGFITYLQNLISGPVNVGNNAIPAVQQQQQQRNALDAQQLRQNGLGQDGAQAQQQQQQQQQPQQQQQQPNNLADRFNQIGQRHPWLGTSAAFLGSLLPGFENALLTNNNNVNFGVIDQPHDADIVHDSSQQQQQESSSEQQQGQNSQYDQRSSDNRKDVVIDEQTDIQGHSNQSKLGISSEDANQRQGYAQNEQD
ncbi:hypothetical protein MP228_000461 [Amoeboaphelidium protococcarum]|nr:hypothetical protein MP228_000461 [Amoeboaphelidium protococcarum]